MTHIDLKYTDSCAATEGIFYEKKSSNLYQLYQI